MRVTSVTSSEVGELICNVTVALENELKPIFANDSYGGGVDQFVVVVVAVDSDTSVNEKFCKSHNRAGTDRHPITGEKVKYISVALPFDPQIIELMTEDQVRLAVCASLTSRLDNLGLKRMPKEFDYTKFATDLRVALETGIDGVRLD